MLGERRGIYPGQIGSLKQRQGNQLNGRKKQKTTNKEQHEKTQDKENQKQEQKETGSSTEQKGPE